MNAPSAPTTIDPFHIRKLFEPLRVADVCDALDGIGYFNIGLVSQEIRPLWLGMKFWGLALTLRCVPANTPMWKLETTEDIVNAHGIWFEEGNKGSGLDDLSSPARRRHRHRQRARGRLLGVGEHHGRKETGGGRHRHQRLLPRHRRDRAAENAGLRP